MHLTDEMCVKCFGNNNLCIPAKLSYASAAPGSCRHTWVNWKKDQTEDYGVEFQTLWVRFCSPKFRC